MFRASIVVLTTVLLADCSLKGDAVALQAEVDVIPSLACVRKVIEAQGIDTGTLWMGAYSKGRFVPLPEPVPATSEPLFLYERSGVKYTLGFATHPDRKPEYTHFGTIKKDAFVEQLEAIRAHLRAVAGAITKDCGMVGLPQVLPFDCSGKHCTDLHP